MELYIGNVLYQNNKSLKIILCVMQRVFQRIIKIWIYLPRETLYRKIYQIVIKIQDKPHTKQCIGGIGQILNGLDATIILWWNWRSTRIIFVLFCTFDACFMYLNSYNTRYFIHCLVIYMLCSAMYVVEHIGVGISIKNMNLWQSCFPNGYVTHNNDSSKTLVVENFNRYWMFCHVQKNFFVVEFGMDYCNCFYSV